MSEILNDPDLKQLSIESENADNLDDSEIDFKDITNLVEKLKQE